MKIWAASAVAVIVMLGGLWICAGQTIPSLKEAKIFALDCGGGDCPLLKGAPQTSGIRAGSVKLKPGESVGWHSTNQNEEALVILRGSGIAKIEGGKDVPLHENMMAYIPPVTHHNVTNTGNAVMEYVWVVAPVAEPK